MQAGVAHRLSSLRIDAISHNGVVDPFSCGSIHRGDSLENRGVVRNCRLFNQILPPVGRFRTREKEYYSSRILGV